MQAEHKKTHMCEVRIYTGEEVEGNNNSVWDEALLKDLYFCKFSKKLLKLYMEEILAELLSEAKAELYDPS